MILVAWGLDFEGSGGPGTSIFGGFGGSGPKTLFWEALGGALGPIGGSSGGYLGASWAILGSSWGLLGPSWTPFWSLFDTFDHTFLNIAFDMDFL